MPEPTATRERPILFSGPMVRAILAGTKTQTRRLVDSSRVPSDVIEAVQSPLPSRGDVFEFRRRLYSAKEIRCPHGARGDRLWVRETWAPHADEEETCRNYSERMAGRGGLSEPGAVRPEIFYRADGGDPFVSGWRPSIFLPRWASRLTLEVLAVRVQRLQDITINDIKAEGITPCDPYLTWKDNFARLWDDINGKRAPWASNPWVWALTFRPVKGGAA